MSEPAASAVPGRQAAAHRVLLAVLRSPLGRLTGGLCVLRFAGRVSGRPIALPVQCARDDTRLVIHVGHAAGKQWWRNFVEDRAVQVRVGGITYRGCGRVVGVDHPDRAAAEEAYRRRYPRATLTGDPLVVVDRAPGPPGEGASTG